MGENGKLNSYKWKNSIEKLGRGLNEIFKKLGYDFISFDENALISIYDKYEENYERIRKNMADKGPIDRHKIISGYVNSILEKQVFTYDGDKAKAYTSNGVEIHFFSTLPNEYFALLFIKSCLPKFTISSKRLEDNRYNVIFPDTIYNTHTNSKTSYDYYLLILLHKYFSSLKEKNFPIFAFAHILFLLEMASDCTFFDMKNSYYAG